MSRKFVMAFIALWFGTGGLSAQPFYVGMDAGSYIQVGSNSYQATFGSGIRIVYPIGERWIIDGRVFFEGLIGYNAGLSAKGLYRFHIAEEMPYKIDLGVDLSLRFGSSVIMIDSSFTNNTARPYFPQFSIGVAVAPLVFVRDGLQVSSLRVTVGTPVHGGIFRMLLLEVELFTVCMEIAPWG